MNTTERHLNKFNKKYCVYKILRTSHPYVDDSFVTVCIPRPIKKQLFLEFKIYKRYSYCCKDPLLDLWLNRKGNFVFVVDLELVHEMIDFINFNPEEIWSPGFILKLLN